MKKKMSFRIGVIVLIIGLLSLNVFAQNLSVKDVCYKVESINFNELVVEKLNNTNTKEKSVCKDVVKIKKFYDLFINLPIYEQKENDNYLHIEFIADEYTYVYSSADGLKVQDGIITNRYYIKESDILNCLVKAEIKGWYSLPVIENTIATVPNKEISKTYEIDVLNKNGIIVGDPDGNLRQNDEITRAEFAAVLCRTMGCETEAQTENITQKKYFPDVPSEHWAAGYINFAYDNKAISGFPDGNFYPEQPVTNEQVIKMLIAAWGYGDEAEANGGYPNGYMKVAKEHGILDTIEFNYANASKRWIASVFVYGILSMTPENGTVKQPVKTQLFTVDTPREENDTYVERPEEILKNVSKESSVYERTVFEQTIPNKYLPIEIAEKTIKNVWYRDFSIGINIVNASGEGFNKQLGVGESVDLSGFALGEYNIIVGYNDGKVDDYSFGKIIISDNNVELSGLMHRYTNVRDVIQFEKENIEVELSNEKSLNDMLLKIKAASDGKGNYILCINYSGSLKDDEVFLYSINDMDLKFDADEKFDAPMDKIEPIVIQGLTEGKEYTLQIRLDSEYLEKSIKGTLTLDNDDFILKGDYQIVNMK